MKRVVIFDKKEYDAMDLKIGEAIDDLKWLRRHDSAYPTFIENLILSLEVVKEILKKEEEK